MRDNEIASYTHDWASLAGVGLDTQQIKSFAAAARRLASERLAGAPLHDGALDMLARLRNDGKLTGTVTSTNRPIFDSLMKDHPLLGLMDVMVARGDVATYKPDPAGIHRALELLDVPEPAHHAAVYIGDKDTDILAAHNAGIGSALFFPENHHELYDREALEALHPGAIILRWSEFFTTPVPKQL